MEEDIFKEEGLGPDAELKEMRSLFNTIHKLVHSGRWSIYYDREGFISKVDWSDDFRHMLGYNNEEDFPNTLGAWSSLLHPDDWEAGYDEIDKVVSDRSGKTIYDVEYRINTKDRGYRWFRAAGDVYRRPDGTVYRFFGVFIDIDDKKKHEELEAQKEHALERAQDATDAMHYIQAQYDIIRGLSNDYVSIYDVQLEIDVVDVLKLESFVVKGLKSDMKGLKYSALIGGYCEGRVHPDDKKEFLRAVSCENVIKELKINGQYEITYRILVSGEIHYFIARYIRTSEKSQPVRALIGFRCVDVVVAEDRKHHDIIEESKALTAIHESLGSGNWSMQFDSSGNIQKVIWSEKFRKMLGYKGEGDFPNTLESWSNLLHKDDKTLTLNNFYSTIEDRTGKKIYDVRYRLLTRAQGYRWFHATGRIVRRQDGSPEVFYGVFMDIDDEMKRDIMLKDALSIAEKSSIAKTTFLNNMSHDIRTPMNAIIGFTTLALSHMGDVARIKDYLEKIQTSSNHLLNLINDVLDMSRIESGKIIIEEKPTTISKILCDIQIIVESTILTKGLNFKTESFEIKDDAVMCDTLRLNQVLLNLLSNAVKFTKSGGSVILSVRQLHYESNFDNCAMFEFRVKDTGIGISAEFLPHVFESFERERTATISGIQGTGLGLAIAKSIVTMMGGSIKVESQKGIGTTFTVILKFHAIADNQSQKKSTSHEEPLHELAGKSILLVEDNELNAQIAQEILEEKGFRVFLAQNGEVALNLIKDSDASKFDLVLMDIQMPVMNGYEATKAIRALPDEKRSQIPIVAMTADAFEEDRQKALTSGMNDHIAKPIDIERVLEVLNRLF